MSTQSQKHRDNSEEGEGIGAQVAIHTHSEVFLKNQVGKSEIHFKLEESLGKTRKIDIFPGKI